MEHTSATAPERSAEHGHGQQAASTTQDEFVLGPVISNDESKDIDLEKSADASPSGTMIDENALARQHTFTNEQLEDLRRTLSKKSSFGGDPLDLEHNFSLERYVREVLNRGQSQGVRRRQAGISFKNVSTYGVGAGLALQPTIADPLLQVFRLKEKIDSIRHPAKKTIIHNFNGVVHAGEMLLVLGKPGAGCSTLLKSLAGEHDGYTGVDGEIHYNGISQEMMLRKFRGEVVYSGEIDAHFPHLTTAQTLEFAAETRLPATRIDNVSRKEYTKTVRDVLATTFGLRHTYNTKVGNDYIRGVSGGERKRVSIAETIASRANVQFWDNSTRGLDASTALEYARALRVSTNLAKTTCVVCIYQAGEQLYEVFDKVTVVYSGRQIYFGPATAAKEYFVNMGFDCPDRQTTADFLTAITDPKARFAREGFADRVPRTPEEFEKAWLNSEDSQAMQREIEAFDQTHKNSKSGEMGETEKLYRETLRQQDKSKRAGKSGPYVISYPEQLKACGKRAFQRMLGDPAQLISSVFGSIFQALIVGSVFYNIPNGTNGFFARGGVIFFAILFNALQAAAEISSLYEQRPILAKHKSYAFYHPSADALAQLLVDIPIKGVTIIVFDIILYFLTNLRVNAGAFFIFLLFTFLITMCMTSFFRALATITKTVDVALTLSGVGILVLVVLTGYVIPIRDVGWWFRWMAYINPIQYSFEALMVNEFNQRPAEFCANLIPSGPGYNTVANQVCAVTGAVPGEATVNGLSYLGQSYGYYYSHLWRNLGIVIAFWLAFLAINVIASEFIAPVQEVGDVVVFRRGHAPKEVEEALKQGKKAEDIEHQNVEVPEGRPEQVAQAKRTQTGMSKLAKSEDIFTWKNLDYDIQIKGETRRLLNNVQGWVKPGTLTALMGESGAGKTTLLNVLAQRVDVGIVTGDMLVNGNPLDHSFQRKTGYVQQQDIHIGTSTVREALRFSAMLRQPATTSKKEKFEYVEEVIKLLEMETYAEAVVGVPGTGLNVEQRKRLTIGVELAAKPALLLFLDEPTSGLDSQSAWSIVLFMRKLANAGQAILCTIHQPSAVLFEQFDRLLLLQKGGRTVYFGDIGENSRTMIDYFEKQGAGKCESTANPAEYILDAIGAGATATTDKEWFELWQSSEEYDAVTAEVERLQSDGRGKSVDPEEHAASDANATYAMGWATQYWWVQTRMFQQYYRSANYLTAKLLLCIAAGLFIGFCFFKQGLGVGALQNKLFAVFLATVLSNSLMSQIQPIFVENRNLFEVRESKSRIYSWSAWFISSVVVELPWNFLGVTLFFFIWYYTIGFYLHPGTQGAASMGIYTWLMLMAYTLWFSSFAQLCASFVPDAAVAAIVSTILFTFVILFNGVLQPPSVNGSYGMPEFWTAWMYHLTPFTYLIAGLVANLVYGNPVVCQAGEAQTFFAPAAQTCTEYMAPFFASGGFGYLTNASSTAAGGSCQFCRFSTGEQFLIGLNMFYSEKWRNFGILCAYGVFNIILAAVLFWLFRVKRFSFSMPALGKKNKSKK